MILSRLADGPAMVLSPQEHAFVQFPSHSLFDTKGYPASPSSVFANSGSSFQPDSKLASAAPVAPVATVAPAAAPKPSRKRSRDDAALEEDFRQAAEPKSASEPVEEPIYGEGMVLLNPRTGIALSAESQTGTWCEEQSEAQLAAAPPVSSRSDALFADAADLSRKSQRLDPSAPGLDDIALSSMRQRLNGSNADDQHRTLQTGTTPPSEPLVDDATRLLGISWQCINPDDDMAPAVRGWTKYIDNQYAAHLRDSRMLMKSRALNAYLVAATPIGAPAPAFYLFSEDLAHAQLVASSWDACLHNLRCSPIAFQGPGPLTAADRNDLQTTNPLSAPAAVDQGVPLLQQALSAHSTPEGLSGGVDMGMEIDS
jgi:hypothetical protein